MGISTGNKVKHKKLHRFILRRTTLEKEGIPAVRPLYILGAVGFFDGHALRSQIIQAGHEDRPVANIADFPAGGMNIDGTDYIGFVGGNLP